MKDVVFIDVDKLGIGFQENIAELNALKDNILKISEDKEIVIHFVSEQNLSQAKYQAALVMNYFNIISKLNQNIIIGKLFTNDVITDLGLENQLALVKDPRAIDEKELSSINDIGLDNVDTLLFLSSNFSVSLWFECDCKKTIVLNDGQEGAIPLKRIGQTILLSSPLKGVKGFNDCFSTYYEAREASHLNR